MSVAYQEKGSRLENGIVSDTTWRDYMECSW